MKYNEIRLIASALETYLIELNKEKDMVGFYYQYTDDEYERLINKIYGVKKLIAKYDSLIN